MVRATFNAISALGLVTCVVLCPYSCMGHLRPADESDAVVESGCGCGCQATSGARTPPQKSGDPRPAPKEPCSCTCICNGALAESPGQVRADELPRTGSGLLICLAIGEPATTVPVAWPAGPEPPPPKCVSGREIRTEIASLLL